MCHAMGRVRRAAPKLDNKIKKGKNKIMPVTLGFINSRKGGRKSFKHMRVLFDSGCTSTIVLHEFVNKIRLNKEKRAKWNTKGGTFITKGKCTTQFFFPEFENGRGIECEVHVDGNKSQNSTYDMVVSSELMNELNIDPKFSTNTINWVDLDPTDSKVEIA